MVFATTSGLVSGKLEGERASRIWRALTVTGQASRLGTAEVLGDYRLFDTLVDRLQEVAPADVQRVAQTYLVAKNRVVGWYTPDKS